MTTKDYLDCELVDDATPYGGKSFSDETLRDFLDSIDVPYDAPLAEVNEHLVSCGIEPFKI